MQLLSFPCMVAVQCLMALALAENAQYISTDSLTSTGTVSFKGSTLRVFEFDGAQVTEPRVGFGDTCDAIKFNHVYLKYQLTFPMLLDINVLEAPTDSSKRVGQVTVNGLLVKTESAFDKDSKLLVLARVTKPGQAQLIFFCDTFLRCQELKDELQTNPDQLQEAFEFIPVGKIGGSSVRFGSIRSANLPRISCPAGQWVVFQRRVDGSLSFAQNWDNYVRGFGNPNSNYWMGLDRLFAMTATSMKNGFTDNARCQLRVEVEDFTGRTFWGEYKMFEVLNPEQNYRLRLGFEVSGSQVVGLLYQNEMQFSTYDKDNDAFAAGSCSQSYGFGGWWFNQCHGWNLNGAYLTDMSIKDSPNYSCIYVVDKFIPMRKSLMKIKCD